MTFKKYKLRSHKGALKRFYKTGSGDYYHKAVGKKHLMAGASRRRQTYRKLSHVKVTARGIIKKLDRLMPYGTTMIPPKRSRQPLLWERPERWTDSVTASKRPTIEQRKEIRLAILGAKRKIE